MTQLDLLEPRCKVPARGSQCWELLMALKAGERLTTIEAFERFRITTISQRMGDLRMKYGWPIKSIDKKISPTTTVSEYFLAQP